MADIFISYSSEDRPRVEPIANTLEEQGWTIFWDRTIPITKTWREVIYTELSSAKCMVVIWTENSKNSKYVLAEVNEAYEKNILIQILFDNIKVPFPFRQEQAADLRDWKAGTSHSGFDLLLSALSEIVGIPTKVKEAEEKRVEEERIHKQEEERKRREHEQRKAEKELQQLEDEKQRLAEEKRKFEEDQKRIEAAPKAEEEHKQEKADTKLKAVEEKRRKEKKDSSNKDTKKSDDYGVLIKKDNVFHILITILLSAAIGIAAVWLFPIVHYNAESIRVYDVEGTAFLIAILVVGISWALLWRKKVRARILLIGFIVCAGLGYGVGILLPTIIEGWVAISINFSLTGAFIGLVFGLLCSFRL